MTYSRLHYQNRTSTLQFLPNSNAEDSLAVLASNVPYINRVFTASRNFGFTWKLTENGLLSPQIEYRLDVSSNLGGLETNSENNKPVSFDANNNPIYSYDSIYYFQRSFKAILGDIFFKDGALARLGRDYYSLQHFR